MFRRSVRHIHFVGIGGIGMSGIAEVLLNLGYMVSGSDSKESETTKRLQELGGNIHIGHRAENLGDANVVVVSSAVRGHNPEVAAAKSRAIPVIPRAEMLAELMRLKYGIAVAGSHGKTTTTSMVATILSHAGLDPTVVIGGKLNALGTNAKLGQGDFFVAESDESDGSFLKLSPTIAVVTNIDPEHLDHYGTFDKLKQAFIDFVNKVPFYGLAVLCLDHEVVQELIPRVEKRYVTYGLATQADYQANAITYSGFETSFEAIKGRRSMGRIKLKMTGEHNVYNALAAIAVAEELEIPFERVIEALSSFEGIDRRFSVRGEEKGVLVIDDYGHHPAEIKATLSGARAGFDRRIIVVFQPHRYSRTQLCFNDFVKSFYRADMLVVTDIYAAGEEPIPGVTSEGLYKGIRDHGHKNVHFIPKLDEVSAFLAAHTQPGDMVLTVGAGDITTLAPKLLAALREKA
jgi:UDP-N-acetylmuramate--alanine ligase